MSEWKTIDSAPKDGTAVLLYRPLAFKTNDEEIAIQRTTSYEIHCWESTIPKGTDGKNFTEGSCYATHWMPLPKPPSSQEKLS